MFSAASSAVDATLASSSSTVFESSRACFAALGEIADPNTRSDGQASLVIGVDPCKDS